LPRWFARTPSAAPAPRPSRAELRIGIPRVLNLWSTHQFWHGLFTALGVDPRHLVFSSDTSEEQGRDFGRGRGTVDCCYPVKCISGHYGELVFGQREKLHVVFSPMIYNLPSFLSGHVARTLTCPRVMAAPENIKAGFMKERDVFSEQGIRYAAPFVSLDEPRLVPRQLWEALDGVIPGLTAAERDAVLGEMRGMLEAVANVTGALATGDTAAIAAIARPVGTAAINGESPTVLAKLPLDMKTAGLAAHQGFDAIADAAAAGAPAARLTGMLADQLTACTSCHALYRLGD